MVMGTYLAVLENNFNSERVQDTIKSGENIGKYKYKVARKRFAHKHVAKKLYQKKHFGNSKIMMISLCKYIEKQKKSNSTRWAGRLARVY